MLDHSKNKKLLHELRSGINMVMDMPDFYKMSGIVADMLKDSLKREGPVHYVSIRIGEEGKYSGSGFFSRGDYRKDAVEIAKKLQSQSHVPNVPGEWERRILESEGKTLKYEGGGRFIELGALDIKRVAEISEGGDAINPERDEKGYKIISREDLMREFRGAIADQCLFLGRSAQPSKMYQPPDDEKLGEWLEQSGKVYDNYMSFPSGSMIVTKDFLFPYVIGRKESENFRWRYYMNMAGHSSEGASIPTPDRNFHLTGVDPNAHRLESPALDVDFSFPMDIIERTFAVERGEESGYIEEAVDSMGKFNAIRVKHFPSNMIRKGETWSYQWYPDKDEFIRAANAYLDM